jgi:hypothetical protein
MNPLVPLLPLAALPEPLEGPLGVKRPPLEDRLRPGIMWRKVMAGPHCREARS